MSNHLGNVLSVVSDRKIVDDPLNFTTFMPDVLSYNDYYPFGQLVPNRCGSADSYRYGFNGMEGDTEVKGEGNSYDFGARMYDPRVGRWFSIDNLDEKYPNLSPYDFVANSPLLYIDPDGEKIIFGKSKSSQSLQKQYQELRKNSKSFKALYDYIDSLEDYVVSIEVDPEYVNDIARKAGIAEEELENVGGLFLSKDNTVYIKDNPSSLVVAEELFHAAQKKVNETCGNSQHMPDKEAEAKLFNQDVLNEEFESTTDSNSIFGRIIGGVDLIPATFANWVLGPKPEEKIINTGELQESYVKYVNEFYQYYYKVYGEEHPYSKEEPSLATPDTYNEIQEILIEEENK